MSNSNSTTVLITGSTSGIGKATAYLLSEHGFRLVLCGRRMERLESLKQELEKSCEVAILNFDIRSKEEVQSSIRSLEPAFSKIDILINNAGNAHGLATIQDGDLEDWDAMIDINVKGLLYLSREIIPGMVERKFGQIINIGSIAGKEVYPNGNVYCASKFAVDAINQGMRLDLHKYGIRVGAINPGLVQTEFSEVRFKGDKSKADQVYKGYQPLKAEDIAEIIEFIITRPLHVNIADLLVLPSDQASSTLVNKSL